jgi:energy-coupling factor transporter ATP-binding protein EcfA2
MEKNIVQEDIDLGFTSIIDFYSLEYLNSFINEGGSKIKFITGKSGSGKSTFLRQLAVKAQSNNYLVVKLDAKIVKLNTILELYLNIVKQIDVLQLIDRIVEKIIIKLGYANDIPEIKKRTNFIEYLKEIGEYNLSDERNIKIELNALFLKDQRFDSNFANIIILLATDKLGVVPFSDMQQSMLDWISGSKFLRLSSLTNLRLSAYKINKYNARNMLRSLFALISIVGYSATLVEIDNLEQVLSTNILDDVRYTKSSRNDAYEAIRELIDDVDTLSHVMFVFAFNKNLIEDEQYGIKSYSALWARIQNEIISKRLNKFEDLLDLEKVLSVNFTIPLARNLSLLTAHNLYIENKPAKVLNDFEIAEAFSKAKYSTKSIVKIICEETIKKNEGIYE